MTIKERIQVLFKGGSRDGRRLWVDWPSYAQSIALDAQTASSAEDEGSAIETYNLSYLDDASTTDPIPVFVYTARQNSDASLTSDP